MSDNGSKLVTPPPDRQRFAKLDPLMKFAVVLAAFLFVGVVAEGCFLVPWTLIKFSWFNPGH